MIGEKFVILQSFQQIGTKAEGEVYVKKEEGNFEEAQSPQCRNTKLGENTTRACRHTGKHMHARPFTL